MALLTGILSKFKRSHATEPPLIVQQISTGFIQQWTQGEATINGTEKARIENDGKFVTSGGMTTGSPATISGTSPTLIFEDTTGGDDDLQFVANADALLLEIVGGTDIANFSATGTTILAPLTVDGTTDILLKANGQIVGYPRTIVNSTTTTGNVGAGEDNLHSVSIAANSLATNGDYLEGEASGRFAANAATKTVRFYVDGSIQNQVVIADGSQGWVLNYKVVRLTSTSVRVTCTMSANVLRVSSVPALTLSTGFSYQANNADEAVSDLAANALVILVTGEATTTDDITQNVSIVQLTQTA